MWAGGQAGGRAGGRAGGAQMHARAERTLLPSLNSHPPPPGRSWSLGTLIYEMLVGFAPFEGADQMTTIRNILTGTLVIPPALAAADPAAADAITQLLARNVVDRLGCRREGAAEIFRHPWFAVVDFEALLRKELPAPWRPEPAADNDDDALAGGRGDARYFDAYEESDGEPEGPAPAARKLSRDGAADGSGGSSGSGGSEDEDEEEDGDDGDAFVLADELPARLLSPIASPARSPAAAPSGGAAAAAPPAASSADEERFFADF